MEGLGDNGICRDVAVDDWIDVDRTWCCGRTLDGDEKSGFGRVEENVGDCAWGTNRRCGLSEVDFPEAAFGVRDLCRGRLRSRLRLQPHRR